MRLFDAANENRYLKFRVFQLEYLTPEQRKLLARHETRKRNLEAAKVFNDGVNLDEL